MIKCDLCGAEGFRVLFPVQDTNYHFPGTWNVVKCTECSLVYLAPRPSPQNVRDYYPDASYTCYSTATDKAVPLVPTHPFVRAIQLAGIPTGRVLDVGCGTGQFLMHTQVMGWDSVGIEPSAYARAVANSLLGRNAVYPSLEESLLLHDSFDAITMWHALEHTHSPFYTLRRASHLLRAGGMLVVAVPNFDSLERHLWNRQWIDLDAPRHLFHFTAATLLRYLRATGFATRQVIYQPAANSMSANLLRTARRWVLDRVPVRTEGPGHPYMAQGGKSGVVASERTKDWWKRTMQTVVYPAAWLVAKLDLGPEVIVVATRQ